MKRFWSFLLVLTLIVGVGMIYAGGGDPDSIIVDGITSATRTIVSNDGSQLKDVFCCSMKVRNTSSRDIEIHGATVNLSGTGDMVQLDNIRLTQGATILGTQQYINTAIYWGNILLPFNGPKVFIPSQDSAMFDLSADLYGWGEVGFSPATVDITDLKTGEQRTVFAVDQKDNNIILINTDHLDIDLRVCPSMPGDTIRLLPGELLGFSAYIGTAMDNYLPEAIGALRSITSVFDENLRSFKSWDFSLPWLYDLNRLGQVTSRADAVQQTIVWTSREKGINGFSFAQFSGYNTMPVGQVASINLYAEAVLYTPECRQPLQVCAGKNVVVESIDGIRGDFNGDWNVNEMDLWLAQGIYTSEGSLEGHRYGKDGFNAGRIFVFSSGSGGLVDIYFLAAYLNSNPLTWGMGYGRWMSEQPFPLRAGYKETLSGNILAVETDGFAVRVATVLPNGDSWSDAALVKNGKVDFAIPDSKLEYQIEAISSPSGATGVDGEFEAPSGFTLNQNYPNPFNPTTTISYAITKNGPVSLKVYDMVGKEVTVLVNETKSAGNYTVTFDGGDLASGVYICRLASGNRTETKKMTLMK